jgi:acetyl esterase
MALHPDIAAFIETLPPADHSQPLDYKAWREGEESRVPAVADRTPQLHAVDDQTAATSVGDVPVRIYTPDDAQQHGFIVYFHGGAFFSGSLETHDHVARLLAKHSGHKIISVGYRRAPEHNYPAGLQDSYAVVEWVADQAESLGWNGEVFAVAGDSSGGTFAAAVSAIALDEDFDGITHQVLLYPSLDLSFDTSKYASLRDNAVGYGLETEGLAAHNAFYLDSGADPDDPLVSPIQRENLAGLPKALIITAEFDPLRDEGEVYGRRLREAGVETSVVRWEGANHGFMQNFAWIPEMEQAYETVAKFLND